MSNGFRQIFTTPHTITSGLTLIERARGFLEAAMLSEQWVPEMSQRALLLEAHHTTHIEGTHLTLDQSRMLLAGNSVPDANPEDVKELLNYRKAFDFVSEYISGGFYAAPRSSTPACVFDKPQLSRISWRVCAICWMEVSGGKAVLSGLAVFSYQRELSWSSANICCGSDDYQVEKLQRIVDTMGSF